MQPPRERPMSAKPRHPGGFRAWLYEQKMAQREGANHEPEVMSFENQDDVAHEDHLVHSPNM